MWLKNPLESIFLGYCSTLLTVQSACFAHSVNAFIRSWKFLIGLSTYVAGKFFRWKKYIDISISLNDWIQWIMMTKFLQRVLLLTIFSSLPVNYFVYICYHLVTWLPWLPSGQIVTKLSHEQTNIHSCLSTTFNPFHFINRYSITIEGVFSCLPFFLPGQLE